MMQRRVFVSQSLPAERRGEESGATIVELLVSLALISIVFLAAGPLIVQSVQLFSSTGRALTDTSATMSGSWLRRDVHSAASIDAWSPQWTDDPIMLHSQNGEIITYEVDGSGLVRCRFEPTGEQIDRRVMLRRVERVRWRALQGLIEIEVLTRAHVRPTTAALIRDRQRLNAVTLKTERFCFALRARGGHSW